MTSVLLRAPVGARKVEYGPTDLAFGVDPDGTFGCPRFAVPELLQEGCVRVDGLDEQIDIRTEILNATFGDLVTFLAAHGITNVRQASGPREPPGPFLPAEELRARALELVP